MHRSGPIFLDKQTIRYSISHYICTKHIVFVCFVMVIPSAVGRLVLSIHGCRRNTPVCVKEATLKKSCENINTQRSVTYVHFAWDWLYWGRQIVVGVYAVISVIYSYIYIVYTTYVDASRYRNTIALFEHIIGILRGRSAPAADFPRDVCLTVSRNHKVFLWSSRNI